MTTDFWFVGLGIYFGFLFGWIYSIGKVLNKNNYEVIKKLNTWSILYLIAFIPWAIHAHDMLSASYERLHPLILLVSGIIGLISIVNIGIIAAKSMKEKEKKEELSFANYVLEFFLIIYMIIGVWVIQPRLNKLMTEK